jgi:pimeloyl-ACP methyl ester carboxylesterase
MSPSTSNLQEKVSDRRYRWQWQGQPLNIAYDIQGRGQPILLLPAFSTVSSRTEMSGLADLLAPQFQVISVDFPGFGESDRPKLDYAPPLYQQFLADFVRDLCPQPIAVIAAGHAAGYALHLAHSLPHLVSKLVLVAPTWRGPLPTMMGGHKPWLKSIRDLISTPAIGQFLYQLNTTPGFLKLMYRRHVYVDATKLTPDFINHKRKITQKSGARYGAGAFVTGGLDPYLSRDGAIEHLQSLSIPVMLILAENSPPKSKAEMQALAAVPGVESRSLPGTLGLHEEYADRLSTTIVPFLR